MRARSVKAETDENGAPSAAAAGSIVSANDCRDFFFFLSLSHLVCIRFPWWHFS